MRRILCGDLEVEVDDGACEKDLWLKEPRHPETLKFLYKKLRKMDSPVMLDIGATQGRYALLAKFVPGMKVFCWEPNPAVLEYLMNNIKLNGLEDRVTIFRCGLWNNSGFKTLHVHPKLRRHRSATMGEHPHKARWKGIKVKVNKLDDFRSHWRKVDLIKLDVEGAEWFVLRGGTEDDKAEVAASIHGMGGKHDGHVWLQVKADGKSPAVLGIPEFHPGSSLRYMDNDMKNFTMFTVPRAFEGEYGIIQTNAIQSWRAISGIEPEILLMGDGPGVARAAKKWDCVHVPGIETNKFGTPLVRSVFGMAQAVARHETMFYVNSDIVFWMESVSEALRRTSEAFRQFLVIGRRHDFHYPIPIDFAKWSSHEFLLEVKKKGKLHGEAALDYFGFLKGQIAGIPDFYLGRRAWDNFFPHDALKRGIPVVDATEVVLAMHIGKTTNKPITEEIRHNRSLAGNAGTWGRTCFATWRLGRIFDSYK